MGCCVFWRLSSHTSASHYVSRIDITVNVSRCFGFWGREMFGIYKLNSRRNKLYPTSTPGWMAAGSPGLLFSTINLDPVCFSVSDLHQWLLLNRPQHGTRSAIPSPFTAVVAAVDVFLAWVK
eukprot:g32845.t1